MPHQVHTPRAERGRFAVDVKGTHPSGDQFENRFVAVLEGFEAEKGDQFLFHFRGFLILERLSDKKASTELEEAWGLWGFSGGPEQGKPGTALLELARFHNS
jgi:hypothetical protein